MKSVLTITEFSVRMNQICLVLSKSGKRKQAFHKITNLLMLDLSNSTPTIFREKCKDSPKVSLNIAPIVQATQPISLSFFRNFNIFLSISNISTMQKIITVLSDKSLNNTFVSSPFFADIAIADTPFSMSSFTKHTSGRRKKIINEMKPPKIVMLSQIPWIFDPEQLKLSIRPTNSNFLSSNNTEINSNHDSKIHENLIESEPLQIVVSDIRHQYRPNSKKFLKLPQLYFPSDETPINRKYIFSPFSQIPQNVDEVINKSKSQSQTSKISIKESPPSHGYCEICHFFYEDPSEHHYSISHQRNSDDFRWTEFDQIAKSTNLL